ncbi:MAG: ImmA/IrrE family metallo-endopeptidase [Bacteroidetes bacterium]|nr:ImmA/IrrE family metallo-endopeptidase [Bacteroidota bacterium]
MSKRRQLTTSRAQEIADLAEEIAGNQLPINPIAILQEKTDIILRRGRFANAFDGLLEWRENQFWVYSNLEKVGPPESPRERFTIAHELGHYFIDEHRNALTSGVGRHPSFSEFQSDELAEREADLFASRLLMPTRAFMDAIPNNPGGMPDILTLKKTFGTSVTSTAIRYVSLVGFFCAVVKWKDNKVEWSWSSQDAYANWYRSTIKSADLLPLDSATRKVMRGEVEPSGFVGCGAVASMWFDYVRIGGRRDEILMEQAISLGQYGFLTLLLPESRISP